jgi:hypothetical protein
MTENRTNGREPSERGARDFGDPQSLLANDALTREQKIAVLRQWEVDLREIMVAEEESMTSTGPVRPSLAEVLAALDQLGAAPEDHPVPTKHG